MKKLYSNMVLCLDFDDVVIKNFPIVDAYIKNINYYASQEWCSKLERERFYGNLDEKSYQAYLQEHIMLKNQILEETERRYYGLIDYSKVYVPENFFHNNVKNINELYNSGNYAKIYIASHYNVERELKYKQALIEKYFPYIELIPIRFHMQPYNINPACSRTNKAAYVKKYLNRVDFEKFVLIDDGVTNVNEWNNAGGIGIRCVQGADLSEIDNNGMFIINSLNPEEIEEAIYKEKVKKMQLY